MLTSITHHLVIALIALAAPAAAGAKEPSRTVAGAIELAPDSDLDELASVQRLSSRLPLRLRLDIPLDGKETVFSRLRSFSGANSFGTLTDGKYVRWSYRTATVRGVVRPTGILEVREAATLKQLGIHLDETTGIPLDTTSVRDCKVKAHVPSRPVAMIEQGAGNLVVCDGDRGRGDTILSNRQVRSPGGDRNTSMVDIGDRFERWKPLRPRRDLSDRHRREGWPDASAILQLPALTGVGREPSPSASSRLSTGRSRLGSG